jgi:hypothetical protein
MSFVIGFAIGIVAWILRCHKKKMKVDPYETAIFGFVFGIAILFLNFIFPLFYIIIPMGIAALFGILWIFSIGFKD